MCLGWLSRAWCVLVVVALSLGTGLAYAKTAQHSAYTYEQTYGSALRLVKVDLGLTITEQNAEWGYLLFEYTSRESGTRKTRGSFEFVKAPDGVQVWVQLPDMPSYHERVIIDKLARKLSEEHGSPPASPPAKRKEKPRDGDSDDKARDKDEAPSDRDKPATRGQQDNRRSSKSRTEDSDSR